MKRLRFSLILAITAVILCSVPCYPDSFGKTLYRSLSAKLGRERADYPGLNDAEFANFRMVTTSGIAPGKLYRSSSPISTWGNRNIIADKFAASADIKTFINLADTDEGIKSHKGYTGSYYSTRKFTGLNLGMKYGSADFRRKLAGGFHFMAVNEPPYLIHCSLGKDRAGFVCAVIECLNGASWDEVERDYMASFRNYFGILPGTREYDFIVRKEIRRFIAENFGIKTPETANLPAAARGYLLGMGVSSDDIESIRRKLGG
ncbi:MAG: tyrosine-protein phosphatase [Synergistaceae bacterium]|nr:tyrosine-protein phosphatase [Synergistaceae bacterium]